MKLVLQLLGVPFFGGSSSGAVAPSTPDTGGMWGDSMWGPSMWGDSMWQ